MTAHTPPPTVVIQDGQLAVAGRLTEAAAKRHVADIKAALDSLEDAISALPDGEARQRLTYRALRLHNRLGRGGQALNDHFQTADVSPDSGGGDKGGGGDDPQNVPPPPV